MIKIKSPLKHDEDGHVLLNKVAHIKAHGGNEEDRVDYPLTPDPDSDSDYQKQQKQQEDFYVKTPQETETKKPDPNESYNNLYIKGKISLDRLEEIKRGEKVPSNIYDIKGGVRSSYLELQEKRSKDINFKVDEENPLLISSDSGEEFITTYIPKSTEDLEEERQVLIKKLNKSRTITRLVDDKKVDTPIDHSKMTLNTLRTINEGLVEPKEQGKKLKEDLKKGKVTKTEANNLAVYGTYHDPTNDLPGYMQDGVDPERYAYKEEKQNYVLGEKLTGKESGTEYVLKEDGWYALESKMEKYRNSGFDDDGPIYTDEELDEFEKGFEDGDEIIETKIDQDEFFEKEFVSKPTEISYFEDEEEVHRYGSEHVVRKQEARDKLTEEHGDVLISDLEDILNTDGGDITHISESISNQENEKIYHVGVEGAQDKYVYINAETGESRVEYAEDYLGYEPHNVSKNIVESFALGDSELSKIYTYERDKEIVAKHIKEYNQILSEEGKIKFLKENGYPTEKINMKEYLEGGIDLGGNSFSIEDFPYIDKESLLSGDIELSLLELMSIRDLKHGDSEFFGWDNKGFVADKDEDEISKKKTKIQDIKNGLKELKRGTGSVTQMSEFATGDEDYANSAYTSGGAVEIPQSVEDELVKLLSPKQWDQLSQREMPLEEKESLIQRARQKTLILEKNKIESQKFINNKLVGEIEANDINLQN